MTVESNYVIAIATLSEKIHRTDRINSISYNKLYPSFLFY